MARQEYAKQGLEQPQQGPCVSLSESYLGAGDCGCSHQHNSGVFSACLESRNLCSGPAPTPSAVRGVKLYTMIFFSYIYVLHELLACVTTASLRLSFNDQYNQE